MGTFLILAASCATADDASSRIATTPGGSEVQASRQSNLQRIQQRKKQVFNWPHNKKLLKLAIYSACQVCIYSKFHYIHSLFWI